MDTFTSNMYYEAITPLEAQDMLLQLQISDYPNGKKENRRKLYKNLVKKAYPCQERNSVSSEQLANFLRGKLNGR